MLGRCPQEGAPACDLTGKIQTGSEEERRHLRPSARGKGLEAGMAHCVLNPPNLPGLCSQQVDLVRAETADSIFLLLFPFLQNASSCQKGSRVTLPVKEILLTYVQHREPFFLFPLGQGFSNLSMRQNPLRIC